MFEKIDKAQVSKQSPTLGKGSEKKPGKVWTFAVPPCCSHWWPPVLRPYLVHLTTNMIMWSYTRWKIMMRTVHIAKNHFVKLLIWGETGAFSRVVSSHHLDTTLACQIFLSIDTFELSKYKTSLGRNYWAKPYFALFSSVREKLQLTVSLNHPVDMDMDMVGLSEKACQVKKWVRWKSKLSEISGLTEKKRAEWKKWKLLRKFYDAGNTVNFSQMFNFYVKSYAKLYGAWNIVKFLVKFFTNIP